MNTKRVLIVAALVAALPLAGCIENMNDLKRRINGGTDDVTPIDDASVDDAKDNVTTPPKKPLRPPVARIAVFAEGGALVYRSSFIAENQTGEPIMMTGGVVSLVSADSEAVEPGSELTAWTWTVDGKAHAGRKVDVNISEPGIHMVELVVTDSKGSKDAQMIHLGIAPTPFEETFEIEGGPIAGASQLAGTPLDQRAEHAFTILAEKDGKPLTAKELVVTISGPPTADFILTITDPTGTETSDDAPTGEFETITLAAVPAGDWKATVSMYAGAADAYTLTFTVTYVEIVEGLGDGHGHAH